MRFWIGIVLSLVVLLAFSSQIVAQGPPGPGSGRGPRGQDPFQRMDTNKDGQISRDEWLQHHSERFKEIDTNVDGFLSKEELQTHHEARRPEHKQRGSRDEGPPGGGPPERE